MRKIISICMCVILLSGNVAAAENGRGVTDVIAEMPVRNMHVGESISYSLRTQDDVYLEPDEYKYRCDSDAVEIDKENRTVTGLVPGIHTVEFYNEEYGFEKSMKIAVSSAEPEIIELEAVYSEDFEDGESDFSQMRNYSLKENEGNSYIEVDGRGTVTYSPLFGPILENYIFEADIQSLGCDAGSNSQLSVGMRAQADNAAYRFANHDVIKYSGSGSTIGSGNLLKNAFSISRGTSNALLAAWYYDVIKADYASMYDSSKRKHIKPYHWRVCVLGKSITAQVTDPDTGDAVVELSSTADRLLGGGAALEMGRTSIAVHSTLASFDNISIKPVISLDDLKLQVDKTDINSVYDEPETSFVLTTVSGDTETAADASQYNIECDGAVINAAEGKITFPSDGEYDITAGSGGKWAIEHISVTARERSDTEAIALAMLEAEPPSNVSENLTLLTDFGDGVTCVWKSSAPSIISANGVISRQEKTEKVRLTAEFTRGELTQTKDYYVWVEGTSGLKNEYVDISTGRLNWPVNSIVPVTVTIRDTLGITDERNITITSDDERLVIDEKNRTITASDEGVYDFSVKLNDTNEEKRLKIAFYDADFPAAENEETVYFEDFDSDDYDTSFTGKDKISVKNGKLLIEGKSTMRETAMFGARDESGGLIPCDEYVFESDVYLKSSDAGSTGHVSVGMKCSPETGKAYHFSNHERITYDETAGKVNTDSAVSSGRRCTFSYGAGPQATSWYIPVISERLLDMYDDSTRGYKKPYHWRVMTTKSSMSAQMSDIESGKIIFSMSVPLKTLYNTASGGVLAPGGTNLSVWSAEAEFDNIKLSAISAFDRLEAAETVIADSLNKPVAIGVSTVSGDDKKPVPAEETVLSCDSGAVEINNGSVTPTEWGEYYITAHKSGKSFLLRLIASETAAGIEDFTGQLALPVKEDSVKENFKLPYSADYEISWLSSDEDCISINGENAVVRRPAIGEADKSVTITAVITDNSRMLIKAFNLTVKHKISDSDAIENAQKLISLPDRTRSDIELPTEFEDGVSVVWSSSSEAISSQGKVLRPDNDTVVVLTASFKCGNKQLKEVYNIVVEGLNGSSSQGGSGGGGGGGGGGVYSRPSADIVISEDYRSDYHKTPLMEITVGGSEIGNVFNDLAGYEWARDSILNLERKGIVKGRGAGVFDPSSPVKREEFVAMICELLKISAQPELCFSDVNEEEWYAKYITAAVHEGIVSGYTDGSFGIGSSITRQDMAVIISRAMKYEPSEESGGFDDDEEISDYARESVYTLKAEGIVIGDGGRYRPFDALSRAEAAVVINRLL